jgi:DNA gyrase subunit B
VKRGKSEVYVKDDAELNALLLKSALEDVELHLGPDAEAMPATALDALARRYMDFQAAAKRAARRYDQRVLETMLALPELPPADREDGAKLGAWGEQLQARLNKGDAAGLAYRVTLQEGTPPHLMIARDEHGSTVEKHLHREFFNSAEYRRIVDLGKVLQGLVQPGAYVKRGDLKYEVGSFHEALFWMLEQARRAQGIQRYKGLGEMNPEQLWDTTINPQTRRLVQVRIEDAQAADEIFATLMGDEVEPRREFIERNALSVQYLDL